MRFCPRCGTPRNGNFCTGCGFAFVVEQPVFQPVQMIPAGWYPEPNDSSKERFWDGSGWTQNIRLVGGDSQGSVQQSMLASILVYPEGFDATKHCSNCGFDLVDSKCSHCDSN